MFQLISIFGLFIFSAMAPAEAPMRAHGESGLKVVVDPATGRIIAEPTAADLEALSRGTRTERRRSMWELRRFALAHGGEGVFLDGWADHALVVQRDAEGRLQVVCSTGDDHRSAPEDAQGNLQ